MHHDAMVRLEAPVGINIIAILILIVLNPLTLAP